MRDYPQTGDATVHSQTPRPDDQLPTNASAPRSSAVVAQA
jgi:hypothetical protein